MAIKSLSIRNFASKIIDSGKEYRVLIVYLHSVFRFAQQLVTNFNCVEDRLRLGIKNINLSFLFCSAFNLHYL